MVLLLATAVVLLVEAASVRNKTKGGSRGQHKDRVTNKVCMSK